jgi:hypothetical protein
MGREMPKKSTDKAGAQLTHKGAGAVRKALGGAKRGAKVPGPSTNPATNLLVADIGIRVVSRLFRRTLEKGLLRLKFPPEKASEVVEGRSLGQTLGAGAGGDAVGARRVAGDRRNHRQVDRRPQPVAAGIEPARHAGTRKAGG